MNSHLNGNIVDSLGSALSQQWTSKYATALVFLVRACLVTCVGTAFVQRQWLIFSSSKQTISVQDFDTISSALGSVMSMCSSVWLQHPLLLILFLISMSMPLAVIVVPASLSVMPTSFISIVNQTKLSPAYRNAYLYTDRTCGGEETCDFHELPAVSRIAFETATSGQIVAAQQVHPNITYSNTFTGPALQCFEANATVINGVAELLDNGLYPASTTFWSWTGAWKQASPGDTPIPSLGCQADKANGCSIFIMSNVGTGGSTNVTQSDGSVLAYNLVNITECRLHNATYTVDYSFQNNIPSITVTDMTYLNAVWNPLLSEDVPFDTYMAASYFGILSAFGNILVGSVQETPVGRFTYQTHYDLLTIDWTEADAVTSGVQELFQNITIGMLSVPSLLDDSTELDQATVTTWHNTFVYNPLELLLPYGIALAISLICTIIGMHAFIVNDGSYQNKFSSFVRAAHRIDFEDSIPASDTGADPLSKQMSQQRITLGRARDDV